MCSIACRNQINMTIKSFTRRRGNGIITEYEFECICTTMMTNIRPDRDSNLVPPRLQPPADTNVPSGPAPGCRSLFHLNLAIAGKCNH